MFNRFCKSKIPFTRRTLIAISFLSLFVVGFLPSQSFSQPLADGKSKFLGNVIHNGYSIRSDFSTYWNQVTPENAGKWGSVESSQGVYNWTELDDIYSYALQNSFPFREHNLIWGSQYPSFITSLDSAQLYQEIVNWIKNCGQRYPEASFCDVVVEPINTPLPAIYKTALGGAGTTGWDWVINAFRLAREYWSPNTKLLLNEYNVISSSTINRQYLQIVSLLQKQGLIDGIGLQGHYFEFKGSGYSWPISTLQANLNTLAATGLPIYIEEFDINEPVDSVQLQNYQTYFPFFYTNPAVKGMTLWGYTEGETWEPYAYLVNSDGTERPALQWLGMYLDRYLLEPVVISPVDTAGVLRDPLMAWHSSIAALSYRLQVATDDMFSAIVVDSTVADTLLRLPALNANTKYYWHVVAMNSSDTGDCSAPVSFTTGDTITGVRESKGIPEAFSLSQNFPNPFNPSTVINYQLPVNSNVTLKVYDVIGREVATLVNGRQSAGYYYVTFNAVNLPSGVYFYQLNTDQKSSIKKMLLLK